MGPAIQHDASGGNAHIPNHIILLLELAVEGVLRAVNVECWRQITLGQPVRVHVAHAEPPIERIDHARRRSVSRNSIQRIGYIAFIQSSAVDIFIVVHQKFARLNAACGKAHNCNIVRVNAVNIRILPHKADSPRYIQRAFLLRVGRQTVIYDEGLEAQLP